MSDTVEISRELLNDMKIIFDSSLKVTSLTIAMLMITPDINFPMDIKDLLHTQSLYSKIYDFLEENK